MRRIVSTKSIQTAIDKLIKQGEKPSIHKIRAITGGSNRLIMKLRDEILNDGNVIIKRDTNHSNVSIDSNKRNHNESRLNSLEARIKELEQTIEQLKKVIMQNDDNVSIRYDNSNDNITTDDSAVIENLKLSQDSNVTSDNNNDTKDNDNPEIHTKLGDIKKVIAEWKTRCTPERAKAARWEKTHNLLIELQEILE